MIRQTSVGKGMVENEFVLRREKGRQGSFWKEQCLVGHTDDRGQVI